MKGLQLYQVVHDGRSWFIEAESFGHALDLWHGIVQAEWGDAYETTDQPDSLIHVSSEPVHRPQAKNGGAGNLAVGLNGIGEVVVSFDQDRVGHIVFSPAQARVFATALVRQADELDPPRPAMASVPVGTEIKREPERLCSHCGTTSPCLCDS